MSRILDALVRDGLKAGDPPPQPAALQVASPLNDVQLVALIAAHVYGGREQIDGETAVQVAVDIVAEAMLQTPGLPALVRLKQQQGAAA